jgi:antitoxin component YwqK of YwqJK toxin-antitoxin module
MGFGVFIILKQSIYNSINYLIDKDMKSFSILSALLLFTLSTFAQLSIDIAKTKKITQNGTEITTFEGKPFTGFVTESYTNGKPKAWITLTNGIANGLWQEWYENGKLKYSAYWSDGKGHGLWEYYHENGVLRQEEFYNLDIPNGIFRDFYNNGQLKSKSSWLNGKKHGVWTYFTESGLLLKTESYNDNKLTATTIEK